MGMERERLSSLKLSGRNNGWYGVVVEILHGLEGHIGVQP